MKSTSFFVVAALLGAVVLVGCSGGSGEGESADWLRENGYELTAGDYLLAAEAGDLTALGVFRERGLEVDSVDPETGDSALLRASGTGQLEAVRHLLAEGANVRLVNQAGRSALILAAQEGHGEVVRLLMTHGADPKLKDRDGWTALTAAAYHGRGAVVEVLAPKVRDQLDEALLVASLQGHTKVIDQLLNRGAYVNTRSQADQTPLMLAAKAGHLDVVEVLVRNGANLYALDRSDRTAANLAKLGGHVAVADFLIDPQNSGFSSAEEAEEELSLASNADASLHGAVLEMPPAEGDVPDAADLVRVDAVEGADGMPVAPEAVVAPDGSAMDEESSETAVASSDGSTSDGALGSDGAGDSRLASSMASEEDSSSALAQAPANSETADEDLTTVAGVDSGGAAPLAATASDSSPVLSMRMEQYREKPLPIMLSAVDGGKAEVRLLAGGGGAPVPIMEPGETAELTETAEVAGTTEAAGAHGESDSPGVSSVPPAPAVASRTDSVTVETGQMIAGTAYRVAGVETTFVSSKEGKGELVDVSRMTVENTDTGEKHLLIKGVPGRSTDTYAVVSLPPGDQRYVVHERDRFSAVNRSDQIEEFEVLEIRPTQVLIENLSTREIITIERDGVAMR